VAAPALSLVNATRTNRSCRDGAGRAGGYFPLIQEGSSAVPYTVGVGGVAVKDGYLPGPAVTKCRDSMGSW
jgi:hypothetical protein